MARKARPAPKLCDRCESFFPSIASETCPQCFAPLLLLTEDEAVRAAEYQMEMLKDPQYLEQKQSADEEFKEQSFGACLGVLVIFLIAVVVSIVLVSYAKKHLYVPVPNVPPVSSRRSSAANPWPLLPVQIGDLKRQQAGVIDQLGMPVSILHATYDRGIVIYALPNQAITSETLADFRLAVAAVDNQTSPPLISQEVHGKGAYYAIIGSNGGLVGDVAQRVVNSSIRSG